MKIIKKIILGIITILIITLFILEIFYNKELTNFDLKVSNYIWSFRNDKLTDIMKFISIFGIRTSPIRITSNPIPPV